MRVHVVFLDSCRWDEVYSKAAGIAASALLLSRSIRRDTGVYIVLRCVSTGSYRWLYINGGRIRNLRPDEESSTGLIKALVWGRGAEAARIGMGLPEISGLIIEVASGGRLQAPSIVCNSDIVVIYNHRGEYMVRETLLLPRPRRLLEHQVAIANIILDRLCSGRRLF